MKILCNHCGKENTTENAFCGGCGIGLGATEAICGACGGTMPPSAAFCGICGNRLARTNAPRAMAPSPVLPAELPTTNFEQRSVAKNQVPAVTKSTCDTADMNHPFRSGSMLREMVLIPGGKFLMGSPADHGNSDETPRHSVQLSRFYIDRFAVSNIEFEQFKPRKSHSRSSTSPADLDPVVFVSYEDCCEYCRWRSEQEGLPPGTYKLPTEAQWEYCARGNRDFVFPWGNEIFSGACNTREAGLGRTVPVDEGLPNGFNLLHMGSNVQEWCSDWYNERYYQMPECTEADPKGPPAIEIVNLKVVRGASFQNLASELSRCAARYFSHPTAKSDDIGFRCVRSD